jgi:LL-diaminopimelate aminotransferase
MAQVNGNYLKLKAGYLFPEIARRVKAFSEANPNAPIIRLGIGDVTEPLPEACRNAMKAAVDEMGTREGFHGYGPEQGYLWLREAIAQHDFQARGCQISAEEIFVSDGSKCDSANILDILGEGNRIAVTDPVYPVYVDSNVMAGRTGDADDAGQYPDPEREGGSDLPLLPQQPHGCGSHQGAAQGLGGLRPCQRRPDPVRCRL